MATIKLMGNEMHTLGTLPSVGAAAPDFTAVKGDLSEVKLSDLRGSRVVLNIFPSLDTPTCAASVRRFNVEASQLDGTVVVCLSQDLPFAQSRFCTTEGLSSVVPASLFRAGGDFGRDYGTLIVDGPMRGLQARAVVVVDAAGRVAYTELVEKVENEPDYAAALAALK